MTAGVINPAAGSRRRTIAVKETVVNLVPDAAAWDTVRNTGGAGLSQTIETTQSEELTGEVLGVRDIIETQRSNEFSYSTELPLDGVGTPYYMFLESILGDEWGTSAADTLVNGNTDVSFSLEDSFTDVGTHQAASGCRCTTAEITIENNSIITATWGGLGTTFYRPTSKVVQAGVTPGTDDVVFTAPNTITFNAGVPTGVDEGEFLLIENASDPSNNGYYRISSVAANDVTVDGTVIDTASDTTVTGTFSGDSLLETTTGAVNPTGANTSAKAGDFIQVEIDDQDVLVYGVRFTNATISLERVSEQLYEITLDDPFTTIATDFTAAISLEWHLINDHLLKLLDVQSEHKLRIVVADRNGNSLDFTFPRIKFSEGAFGEASRGESMTGTASSTALLTPANEMVSIVATNV